MNMNKTDFIEAISDNCKLSRPESKRSIEVILEQLSEAIASGKGVEIRGFGRFYKRFRKSRIGINPMTGEKTHVEDKFVPFFKPGKRLKETVNNG